jgi:hypothetical protein
MMSFNQQQQTVRIAVMYVTPVVLVQFMLCFVYVPMTSPPTLLEMPCSFKEPSAVEYVCPFDVKNVAALQTGDEVRGHRNID